MLKYKVEIQPVTHSSGQITLTITLPEDPTKIPVFCKSITIEVPIGPGALDMFTKAPVIRSNSSGWAPSSYISAVPAVPAVAVGGTVPANLAPTALQRFVVLNQNADKAVEPFSITITGNVNTVEARDEKGVKRKPQLKIEEISGLTKEALVAAGALQKATIDLTKAHSRLLYIDSFYASAQLQGDGLALGESIPITKFRSGEAFKLSWESNGTNFQLYQDHKLADLAPGETTSHTFATGIFVDTTFVLKATKNGTSLYASLTVAVSNPAFIAEPITLQRVLEQTDDNTLKIILELDGGDVKRALLMSSSNVGMMLQRTQDPKLQKLLSEYLFHSSQYPSGNSLKNVLEKTDGIALKNALKETTDANLKSAIEQAPDASLRDALQPVDIAKARSAIRSNDVAILKRLVGRSNDPKIKTALRLADSLTLLPLEQSDDTDHCLRVGDGTQNGNIVLQAQTGDNSGLTTLSFNGYSSGGEKRFNPAKTRYQVGTDQRGAEDLFFVKVHKYEIPITAFTINPQAQVGISTLLLGSNGHVNDNTSPSEPNGKKLAFSTSEVYDDGYQFYGLGNSGKQLNFFAGGDTYSAPKMVLNSSGSVGIGTTSPFKTLDVIGSIGLRNKDATWDHLFLHHDGGTAFMSAGGAETGLAFRVSNVNSGSYEGNSYSYKDKEVMRMMPSGFVGIGTTTPQVPLHVNNVDLNKRYNINGYRYYNCETQGNGGGSEIVSIVASHRIVAAEFNANSDARLKTVVGHSDAASDLKLLRRLRITDYTMRDRVQFGNQAFKKIIAQELEEVFPQAVHQHTGFLPDIYANANQVQRQGEALLISLPAGLPQAATAGQRLKLIGPVGEVLATLAEAAEAGSQQLLVSGADSLADTPNEVFVFGLEHADVRTVDYEAVAMLNVSATQALARQVEELHQQNAALNAQCQAQGSQADELRAALLLLQQQVAVLLSEPRHVAQPA